MQSARWKRLFGDRKFYSMVLAVALPIMAQNGVTNFVSMLDNIMVGQLGTEPMSGVAIANQLLFVFNLCIFGATSGAGIFGAQFYGSGDTDGLRSTFQFKLLLCAGLTVLAIGILMAFPEPLIRLYLHEGGSAADIEATLQYGLDYVRVMLWGLFPFMIVQVYSSTLRETGQTIVPMVASMAAILVNLTFNYFLIFGRMGFPRLEVRGAAIATVLSRFVELAVIAGWTHAHAVRNRFVHGVYRKIHIPGRLAKQIFVILRDMELIPDMEIYREVFFILRNETLNGRHVCELLEDMCKTEEMIPDMERAEQIFSYRDYPYMKKRWEKFCRHSAIAGTETLKWEKEMECFHHFLGDMWEAVCRDEVFFGDWMPELARFLG